MDKVKYISEFPITYKALNVCNDNAANCLTCDKCIRTMGELYAIKKLDNYREVFDVDHFKSHQVYYCRRLIEKCYDGSIESSFNKEILQTIRKNGMRVPIVSYLLAVPKIILNLGQKFARKSKYLTKLNHKRLHNMRGLYFNDIDI